MTHWIDEAAKNAALSYLRRCEIGGMPAEQAKQVKQAIEEMAHYGYFSLGVSEAIIAQGLILAPAEAPRDQG
jgi:hypothetical protein